MRVVFYRTYEESKSWRAEYDLECPDHIVQQIQAGTHPDYATLAEWAQNQDDFDVYGSSPSREIVTDRDIYDGEEGAEVA